MVEGGERVGLAAAELRRHVEIGARLHRLAGQPAHHLRRKLEEATGEIGAVEEPGRVEVIGRHAPPLLANMVEVDRKLGRIERPVFAEILAGGDNLIPGLWCSSGHAIHPSVVSRSGEVSSTPSREHWAWHPSAGASPWQSAAPKQASAVGLLRRRREDHPYKPREVFLVWRRSLPELDYEASGESPRNSAGVQISSLGRESSSRRS